MPARKREIRFTKRSIEALQPPVDSDREYWFDRSSKGLAVCITASNVRTFYMIRKVQGRPQRIRLGLCDELGIPRARKLAAQLAGDIASGIDPMAERRAERRQCTLGQLWERYFSQHSKPHKRTWKHDEWRWHKDLAQWQTRRLDSLTRAEVKEKYTEIGTKRGPCAANLFLSLVKHMYKMAPDLVGYEGHNPALGISGFKKPERDRFMNREELGRFQVALESVGTQSMRDALLMALWTGARRGNVCSMKWSDLDLSAATWRIPAERSKSGEVLVVHLSEPALDILKRRKLDVGDCPWVFPGRGPEGHLVEIKHTWRQVLDAAGLTDLRPHDLRRTFASWQIATGSTLPMVSKALGHRSVNSTRIYARLDLSTIRGPIDAAVAAMQATAKSASTEEKSTQT